MKRVRVGASSLVACLVCATVMAAEVMRESEVTEQALIDALRPVAPMGPTRAIRLQRVDEPSRRAVTSDISAAEPQSPKASLLVTFRTNSTVLTPEARQALDVVSRALTSEQLADFRFNVEGHADPRGDSEANLKLSEQRAEAVRQYLVGTRGLRAERLVSVGKGDREPLNARNPAAAENRRVTFVTLAN